MSETVEETKCSKMAMSISPIRSVANSYKLPETFNNDKGAAIFQTVGALISKGRTVLVSGNMLDSDYLYNGFSSDIRIKENNHLSERFSDTDLYLTLTDAKNTYAVTYNFQYDRYCLYKVDNGVVSIDPLFDLFVYKGMTAAMASSLLSKFLFVF